MKKILVIRFSSIGDIVLTSAVVRCLKEQLNCELHFITKSAYASFVKANQYVDKVYDFKQEITEVITELKNEQYDFACGFLLSAVACRTRLSPNLCRCP